MRTTSCTLPALGELDGVSHQIDENLAEPRRIGANRLGDQAAVLDFQQEVFRGRPGPHQGGHLAHQAARRTLELFDGHLAGLDLRDVEDVVDDAQQMVAVPLDRMEKLLAFGLADVHLQDQVGVAENGGHGRADFVAHVGQELALCPAGGFRGFLGDLEFGRAIGDAVLQLVAGLLQGVAPLLDLVEHGVETVVQQAEFVVASFLHADRVIVFVGDALHGVDQPLNRLDDKSLQPAGQEHRHGQRRREHRQRDPHEIPNLFPQFAHARAQVDRAYLVAARSELVRNVQAIGADERRAALPTAPGESTTLSGKLAG